MRLLSQLLKQKSTPLIEPSIFTHCKKKYNKPPKRFLFILFKMSPVLDFKFFEEESNWVHSTPDSNESIASTLEQGTR